MGLLSPIHQCRSTEVIQGVHNNGQETIVCGRMYVNLLLFPEFNLL